MKTHFNILITGFFALCLSSCSNKFKSADEGYYSQDFDNLKMWTRDQLLTNEHAHSGNYSAYTDSTHEFSQTFEMDFNYAKSKGYTNLRFAAWCYVASADPKAGLIASVESPEKSLAYGGIDLTTAISEVLKWQKVSGYLKFPETAPEGTKIKIYLWSPKKQKVFVDDIELQFGK